jgi:hypothetical protein
MELLNTSVYESPILMVTLFLLGGIGLLLILVISPEEKKTPMLYNITKTELKDDTYKKSCSFFWILLIMAIILYLIL